MSTSRDVEVTKEAGSACVCIMQAFYCTAGAPFNPVDVGFVYFGTLIFGIEIGMSMVWYLDRDVWVLIRHRDRHS